MNRLFELVQQRSTGLGYQGRAADLFQRDVHLGLPSTVSANGSCHIFPSADGHVALNMARKDDWDMVPVMTGEADKSWAAIKRFAAYQSSSAFAALAAEFQLPAAYLGEANPMVLADGGHRCSGLRVVDMSALWAGPLCGALLAQSGAKVIRVASIGRPDPTEFSSPQHFARLHGEKAIIALDLRTQVDRMTLQVMIAQADILITSGRPAALARLGLDAVQLAQQNPRLIWCAITGHGFYDTGAGRVGFGDDAAVAGGLVRMVDRQPQFIGDAVADPLTGIESALAISMWADQGRGGVIDMPLSRVAAAYAGMLA